MPHRLTPLFVALGGVALAQAQPPQPTPQAPFPPQSPPQAASPQQPGPGPTLRDFEPMPSRWFAPGRPVETVGPDGLAIPVAPGDYVVNEPGSPWNPYRQNRLKGDFPILGTEDLFFAVTVTNRFFFEKRDVPTPAGITGPGPVNPRFFGDSRQTFLQDDLSVTFDLFRGQQAFKPVDWRVRVTPVFNYTRLDVGEVGVVVADPSQGTVRERGDVALQEAFVEYHLFDLGDRYDFCSVEAGVLPFRSDFRGFVFEDTNLGVRFFGNADENKWQYNLVLFDQLDKDTNSGLNRYEDRDQNVLVANLYRQDWPVLGYTTSASFHYNRDRRGFEFDDNGFLVAPAPIGNFASNDIDAYYLGWAGEGHFGRWNITHAFYQVFGEESANAIAARATDIDARFAAAEISYDIDWLRPRLFGLYASGDSNPTDGKAEGFDAILDNPNFGGGQFSYWNSQGLRFVGTGLTSPGSPLADLQTSKTQGQSNFVNPGILQVGGALDAELTPKWRGQIGCTYLRFDDTAPLETLLQAAGIKREIGFEVFLGTQYRPFLNNHVIVQVGGAVLQPGDGFARIYENGDLRYTTFVNVLTTW